MKGEVWKSETENSYTVLDPENESARRLFSQDAVLLYTIEADTWKEIMQEFHRRMGWEPYKQWNTGGD